MTFTTYNPAATNNLLEAVPSAITAIKRLSVDDQLGLLWILYKNLGKVITPAAPGVARLQLAEGMLNQIKAMSPDEQLQMMRDLVRKVNTPISRSYGIFSNNTKLAIWYQLAQWMETGEVIAVPQGYKLSAAASAVFNQLTLLEFGQQITVLRQIAGDMGVDPLAV
ncbi:MAG: Orange carotenoid protein [Chloroflexaceae bacterium]|nr:Orange carotenoid protein [Chloroflexaceae bacterium]